MVASLEQPRAEKPTNRSRPGTTLWILAAGAVGGCIATLVAVFVAVLVGVPRHVTTGAMSPDERYIATVYQQGWFPARHATAVTLRPSLSKLFSRDSHDVFVIDSLQGVGVFWSGERELTIVCVACRHHTYVQHEQRWRDVDIKVVEYDQPQ